MRRAALILVVAACKLPARSQPAPAAEPVQVPTMQAMAPAPAPVPVPVDPPPVYLKGSTHVHTVHSGDSGETTDEVIAWYESRGYDFIVLTDHNRVTDIEHAGDLLVLDGIEFTNNPGRCDPPPPEPAGKCRIHVNGLFVTTFPEHAAGQRPPKIDWRATGTISRADLYQAAIDKTRELGGIVQINHPAWHWGVDGALLAELGRRGVPLFEVANTAFSGWNDGDAAHASTDRMWDDALAAGVMIYGVASDDAHHYDPDEIARRRASGQPVYTPGGGWVMVHAERTAGSIRDALARGDFYSTTGVLLERAGVRNGRYEVALAPDAPGEAEISFIGKQGLVLHQVRGRSADLPLDGLPPGTLRAVVRADGGARAWTQPVAVP